MPTEDGLERERLWAVGGLARIGKPMEWFEVYRFRYELVNPPHGNKVEGLSDSTHYDEKENYSMEKIKFIEIPIPVINGNYLNCVFCGCPVDLQRLKKGGEGGICDGCGVEYRLLDGKCAIRPYAISDGLRRALYDLKKATT